MRISLSHNHADEGAGLQGPTRGGQTSHGSFAHALLAGLLLIALPAMGLTQQGRPGQTVAQVEYHTGVVTANNGTVLHIDGKAYRLDHSVTVTDEEGSVYAVEDLKRGEQIKFHLRKRRIDHIIWILPR